MRDFTNSSNIESIEFIDEEIQMMDITVPGPECFYANGILTHNCAEELRIVTNLSKETVWADTINSGGDLHAATAIQIFGKVDKVLRGYCKSINFGILYGMTKFSLAERIKQSIQAADNMLKKWHQKLARIDAWMKLQIKNARKTHTTQTYYGRVRTLDKYYNSSDPGMVGFADRSALNTPVQGCVPEEVMFEMGDQAVYITQSAIDKYDLGSEEIILSHRGESPCYLLVAKSGDFIICNRTHLLFERSKSTRKSINALLALETGKRVELSPLGKKHFTLKDLRVKSPLKRVVSMVQSRPAIKREHVAGLIFAAWVKREEVTVDHMTAASLRSVASICGFNLVCKSFTDVEITVTLKSRRNKSANLVEAYLEGTKPVCSASVRYGAPVYKTQGFINHNTAADILRIKLCELYHLWQTNQQFHDNVIIMWHVHDEVEFYVKKGFVKQAVDMITSTMKVVHDNWLVPLVVEPGIGYSWGCAIDGKLNEEGKFISIPDAKWYEGKKPSFIID